MKIDYIAFDSFGVKSNCIRVKTRDVTITVDPGVAVETGSYPLNELKRVYLREKYKEKIRESCLSSDIVILTHYHYDHHRLIEDFYKDKKLILKDPKNNINKSQKKRAQKLLDLTEEISEIEIGDSKEFDFGNTKVRFTNPLWHGPKNTKLGYVISCIIEDKDKKIYYSSDLDGPYLEKYADMIIEENPDILVLDGPPTYLLGFIVSYQNFAKSILNILKILKNTDSKVILDHHLLRDYRYKDLMKPVYDYAESNNKKVLTAAEDLGKRPKVLELYEKNGPTKWKNWIYLELDEVKKLAEGVRKKKAMKSRKEKLRNLNKEIENCNRCSLCENVRNKVPGEGPLKSKIMLVGEAPGEEEDKTGRPFVGRAGELLNELLEKAGLERDKVFITSILKCRPPKNRNPYKKEIEACKSHLEKQINLIKPQVIVPLGNVALEALLDKKGITDYRGEVYKLGQIKYIPAYHPAAAVYNANLKETIIENFKKIKKEAE